MFFLKWCSCFTWTMIIFVEAGDESRAHQSLQYNVMVLHNKNRPLRNQKSCIMCPDVAWAELMAVFHLMDTADYPKTSGYFSPLPHPARYTFTRTESVRLFSVKKWPRFSALCRWLQNDWSPSPHAPTKVFRITMVWTHRIKLGVSQECLSPALKQIS